MLSKIVILSFVFILLRMIELRFPLRLKNKKFINRFIVNFSMQLSAWIFVQICFFHWIKIEKLPNSSLLKNSFILSFLVLDLFIYSWHYINHRFNFFWKFHKVHHFDQELDVSTAFRFHFMELFLSAIFRTSLAIVVGLNFKAIIAFEIMVTTLAMFHHANIKIPFKVELKVQKIIVTPRMHELHHSKIASEYNSNFGTIFSLWDKLFRTESSIFENQSTTIGLAQFENKDKLEDDHLTHSLSSPFV